MLIRYRGVLVSSIALCALASPLAAQTWSAEQQEVLAVVEQSWVDDLAKDATWVDRFTHSEVLSWGNDYPVPRDQAASKRWSAYDDQNSTASIHTIAPVGITVRGDAAVVHYYSTVGAEDHEGKPETTSSRCTDTLTRDGNTWRYLGWFCFNEPSDGN